MCGLVRSLFKDLPEDAYRTRKLIEVAAQPRSNCGIYFIPKVCIAVAVVFQTLSAPAYVGIALCELTAELLKVHPKKAFYLLGNNLFHAVKSLVRVVVLVTFLAISFFFPCIFQQLHDIRARAALTTPPGTPELASFNYGSSHGFASLGPLKSAMGLTGGSGGGAGGFSEAAASNAARLGEIGSHEDGPLVPHQAIHFAPYGIAAAAREPTYSGELGNRETGSTNITSRPSLGLGAAALTSPIARPPAQVAAGSAAAASPGNNTTDNLLREAGISPRAQVVVSGENLEDTDDLLRPSPSPAKASLPGSRNRPLGAGAATAPSAAVLPVYSLSYGLSSPGRPAFAAGAGAGAIAAPFSEDLPVHSLSFGHSSTDRAVFGAGAGADPRVAFSPIPAVSAASSDKATPDAIQTQRRISGRISSVGNFESPIGLGAGEDVAAKAKREQEQASLFGDHDRLFQQAQDALAKAAKTSASLQQDLATPFSPPGTLHVPGSPPGSRSASRRESHASAASRASSSSNSRRSSVAEVVDDAPEAPAAGDSSGGPRLGSSPSLDAAPQNDVPPPHSA